MARYGEPRDPYEQMSSLIQTISGIAEIAGKSVDRKERRMADELQSWQTNLGLRWQMVDPYDTEKGDANIQNFINTTQTGMDNLVSKYPGSEQFISSMGNTYIYGANQAQTENSEYSLAKTQFLGGVDPQGNKMIGSYDRFTNTYNKIRNFITPGAMGTDKNGLSKPLVDPLTNSFNQNLMVEYDLDEDGDIDGDPHRLGDVLQHIRESSLSLYNDYELITKRANMNKWADNREDFVLGDFGKNLARAAFGMDYLWRELGTYDSVNTAEWKALENLSTSGNKNQYTQRKAAIDSDKQNNVRIQVGLFQDPNNGILNQLQQIYFKFYKKGTTEVADAVDLSEIAGMNANVKEKYVELKKQFPNSPNLWMGYEYEVDIGGSNTQSAYESVSDLQSQVDDITKKFTDANNILLSNSEGARNMADEIYYDYGEDAMSGRFEFRDIMDSMRKPSGGVIAPLAPGAPPGAPPAAPTPPGWTGTNVPNAFSYIQGLSKQGQFTTGFSINLTTPTKGGKTGVWEDPDIGKALGKELKNAYSRFFQAKMSGNINSMEKLANQIAKLYEEKFGVATDPALFLSTTPTTAPAGVGTPPAGVGTSTVVPPASGGLIGPPGPPIPPVVGGQPTITPQPIQGQGIIGPPGPPIPPTRPTVPVEEETEFLDEDIVIEDTDFMKFTDWDPPVPRPDFIQSFPFNEENKDSLGVIHNNPGNLKIINTEDFAKFNSPENGWRALYLQVETDRRRGDTIEQFIKGGNPVRKNDKGYSSTEQDAYIKFLTQELKVSKTTPISEVDIDKLVQLIARQEGYLTKDGEAPTLNDLGVKSIDDLISSDAKKKETPVEKPKLKFEKGGAKTDLSDSTDIVLGGRNIDEFISTYFTKTGKFQGNRGTSEDKNIKEQFTEELDLLLTNNKYYGAFSLSTKHTGTTALKRAIREYLQAVNNNSARTDNKKEKLITLLNKFNKDWTGEKSIAKEIKERLFKKLKVSKTTPRRYY
jgi:hypothetical protein